MPILARRRSLTAPAFLACVAAIALAACGGPPRPGQPRGAGDGCELGPAVAAATREAPGANTRPVVVGMPDGVNPANAPVPRNAAERLVFAQLYETLVRVGCDGRIEPGLAAEWRAEDGGRSWVFKLRDDARDWTGAPVTTRDVAESWLASPDAPGRRPAGSAEPRLAALTVLDARTMRAQVGAPVPLHWFARPELAVRTAADTGGWPAGTGPLRPETRAPATGVLRRLVLRSAGTGTAVEFRALPADPRNAVDGDVDLLVTRDPAVADYAVASGAFDALPLPWDRAYVLLSRDVTSGAPDSAGPVRAPGASDGRRAPEGRAPSSAPGVAEARAPSAARATHAPGASDARAPRVSDAVGAPNGAARFRAPRIVLPPDSVLRALARDAVRAHARPARELFAGAEACGAVAERPEGLGGMRGGDGARAATAREHQRAFLLYPPGDEVAQALAERLVALAPEAGRAAAWLADAAPELAAASARARAGTVGRDEDFAAALRRGAAPVVTRVDRVAGMDACAALAALLAAAPWLAITEGPGAPSEAAPGAREAAPVGAGGPRVVPLIETRPVVLLRRGVAGVAVDGHGTLLLGRLRRTGGGTP